MAITVQCPCGKMLKAKEESAGKLLKCPGCGQGVRAPSMQEAKSPRSKSDEIKEAPPRPKRDEPEEEVEDKPRKSSRKKTKESSGLTPLEKIWKKSRLLGGTEFQIVWNTVVAAKGRGCSFYQPGTKETLGQAEYRDSAMRFLLRLFNLASFVPPWIEFKDEDDEPLFCLKVVSLVNNRYDIYAPDRQELLGSLKTIFSTKLWLRLLDQDGNDVGEMVSADLPAAKGKGSYFGFHVNSTDGRTLGEITTTGFHLSRFNLANKGYKVNVGYVGRVTEEFADDPRTKALVLAATWVANVENMGVRHFDPMKA